MLSSWSGHLGSDVNLLIPHLLSTLVATLPLFLQRWMRDMTEEILLGVKIVFVVNFFV